MGTKKDCAHDVCDCPCHKGKLIDANGKVRINHKERDCGCVKCPHCKLRIKKEMSAGHPARCPENSKNTSEEDRDKTQQISRDEEETKVIPRPPDRRRETRTWRKHSPQETP